MQRDSNRLRFSLLSLSLALAACGPISADTDGDAGSDASSGASGTSAGPGPTDGATGPGPAPTTGELPPEPTGGGGTGGGTCDGSAPGAGEAWGPCRDELPEDPQWATRCDGGIFCTEIEGVGTICLPGCEFPEGEPWAGECPCGSPSGEAACAPLLSPTRPDRPCLALGGCPEGMAATEFAGCVWEGQGLAGGPAAPETPDPSCGAWPPAAGEAWGPCLLDATCAPGSTCRIAEGGGTICEPSCELGEITTCPGQGCFGFPAELFCTGPEVCEVLCTWGAGDEEGSCPAGMECDATSRCAWA